MARKRRKQANGMGKQQCQRSEGSTVSWMSAVATRRRVRFQVFTDHCFQPKKAFEFLKLPAEIRNMIYWNVLVKRHSFYRFAQPPLTLVNKQIRCESLPILYGNGLFFAELGPYFSNPDRFLQLQRLVPAIPNLAHITKLDIRFSLRLECPTLRGVDVLIYMRGNKLECGSLGNNNLVGEPGLEWKDRAKLEIHYRRLLNTLSRDHLWYIPVIFHAEDGMRSVVRTLLCFAERYPAAAKWVWMVIEWRSLVA